MSLDTNPTKCLYFYLIHLFPPSSACFVNTKILNISIYFYLNLQSCSIFTILVFTLGFLVVTDRLSSPELFMLGF